MVAFAYRSTFYLLCGVREETSVHNNVYVLIALNYVCCQAAVQNICSISGS
jgi:hypothetical protein